MPTAGKLAGAIFFAILAFILAGIYRFELERDYMPGSYYGMSMVIGLLCGWLVMGPRTHERRIETANSGLLTTVVMIVACLIYFSTLDMLRRATNQMYAGPLEAVTNIFQIAGDNVTRMASLQFVGTALVGGIICGLLAGQAGRRWT